jgi:hypothetical protein
MSNGMFQPSRIAGTAKSLNNNNKTEPHTLSETEEGVRSVLHFVFGYFSYFHFETDLSKLTGSETVNK